MLPSSVTAPTPLNLPLAMPQPNEPSLSVMFLVSSSRANKSSLVVVGFDTSAMTTPGSVDVVLNRHVAASLAICKLMLMTRSVSSVMLGSVPPKLLYWTCQGSVAVRIVTLPPVQAAVVPVLVPTFALVT